MNTKVCSKCKEWKVIDEFYKRKASNDGYYPSCKKCKKEFSEKQYQENKEKVKERMKKNYQENKEAINKRHKEYRKVNKEKTAERMKDYGQANKGKIAEYQKKYRQTNKEKIVEFHKEYRRANKEKRSEQGKEYYLLNKENINKRHKEHFRTEQGKEVAYRGRLKRRSHKHKVSFAPHRRMEILERDNWKCQSCGIKVQDESKGKWNTPNKCHIDHIIPISKGGNSEPKNLRVLCRTCNLSKRDKQDEQLMLFN